ncbi:hypothetical protein CYY_001023 [Polysphondylium violaceum]|uniref:Potassium channel tetramerisation-type BTB domain-containing protein n=1 Tax=Polysphondylium violaceum TaxID=133409 RepID=A0A8J4Q0T5_9MYCE|nr:hypothetical protein CYY_001023 [Polysphondylium violaceum]
MENKNRRKHIAESINGLKSLILEDINLISQEVEHLEQRKKDLLDVKKVIDESMIPDPIILDVGGKKFKNTKSTLRKIPGSYFDVMLSGEIDIKPMIDKPNTYFIDRDPTYFSYILNYLREDGKVFINDYLRLEIRKEMLFYRLLDPKVILPKEAFRTFPQWNDSREFKLIFKASEHGFKAESFHEDCDGKEDNYNH